MEPLALRLDGLHERKIRNFLGVQRLRTKGTELSPGYNCQRNDATRKDDRDLRKRESERANTPS